MDIVANSKEFVKTQLSWVKAHETEIILGIGVALVSLLSFAIGYITAKEQLKQPIQIEQTQQHGTTE